MKKKKRRPEQSLAPPQTAHARWPLAALVFALTIIVMPLLPSHPLWFLPPLLYWPVYIIGALLVAFGLREFLRFPTLSEVVLAKASEVFFLVLIFGSYLLLKVPGLHASGTDDNIYFYMAVRMADGAVPYRDFFFAHPPMHLIIPCILFKIFGFSIGLAKAIPAVAQGIAGIFLYLGIRRFSKSVAILTVLFHLTAYQVLMGSTDMNGENLMTMFLAASTFFAFAQRPVVSGILAACGISCGLYAFAWVLALALAHAFASRWRLKKWAVGFFASLAAINLPFAVLAGSAYLDGVLTYHLAKPIKGEKWPVFSWNPFSVAHALFHNLGVWVRSNEFKKSLYYHAPFYMGSLLALAQVAGRVLFSWMRGQQGRDWARILSPSDLFSASGLVKFSWLCIALFNLQWAALNEVYDFYHVPMIPFLCMPTAVVLVGMVKPIGVEFRWKQAFFRWALIGLFWLHLLWAYSLSETLWPEEHRRAKERVVYDWRDPEFLEGIAQVTKALFFAQSRLKGEVTPYYRHYLWNKRLTFSTAKDIADYVRATTAPDETLTGASTLAPLVALLAERRIAADEADTNAKRFKSRTLTEADFFRKICADRVRYIISAARSYFYDSFMASNATVRDFFEKDKVFVDQKLLHFAPFSITLYRRVDKPGLLEGLVCEPR